ncbi:hypothetical protein Bbelb_318840 [Branchiostoma belcheri]|nr:hypothetical protein Bbelb_318840 [Branchiostoma belcheri]
MTIGAAEYVTQKKAQDILKEKEHGGKNEVVMQTIPCYAGDHSRCSTGSLVCRHPRKWTFKYLPEKARGHIQPNDADLKLLMTIMQHRLGKKYFGRHQEGEIRTEWNL